MILFPQGDYSFEVETGRTMDDRGKSHWPALLRVYMTREQAIQAISYLAGQLTFKEETEINISWCGAMEREEGSEV